MDKAKIRNFFINFLALGVMALISVSQIVYAEPVNKAYVNGIELKNNIYKNENGAIMCPVREISDILGYTVEWNAEENSCLVGSESVPSVKYYIGEDRYIYAADAVGELGSAPVLRDGLSYVPSDFFGKFFSLDIAQTEDGTVIISDGAENNEVEQIKVKKGESFEIILEENPSTGYQWTVEKDDAMELVETKHLPSDAEKGTVGAPNDISWTFKCDVPGEYTIKCTYERSFEENSAVNTVEFNIVVE